MAAKFLLEARPTKMYVKLFHNLYSKNRTYEISNPKFRLKVEVVLNSSEDAKRKVAALTLRD